MTSRSSRQVSQIMMAREIEGVRIMLLTYRNNGPKMYALGVHYSGDAMPDSYGGTTDLVATYRAYVMLLNFLHKNHGPIRRRRVSEYAEDCRYIVGRDRADRRNDASSTQASATVMAMRDTLGLEMFLHLRDFPVEKMPPVVKHHLRRAI